MYISGRNFRNPQRRVFKQASRFTIFKTCVPHRCPTNTESRVATQHIRNAIRIFLRFQCFSNFGLFNNFQSISTNLFFFWNFKMFEIPGSCFQDFQDVRSNFYSRLARLCGRLSCFLVTMEVFV